MFEFKFLYEHIKIAIQYGYYSMICIRLYSRMVNGHVITCSGTRPATSPVHYNILISIVFSAN